MNYVVNPESLFGIFAVPNDVVDKHIKLAGSAQLKTLLWYLRHMGDDLSVEDMAKDIGLSQADSLDALQYWSETGVIIKREIKADVAASSDKVIAEDKAANKDDKQTPIKIIPPKGTKPSFADVARRGKESSELKFLFIEAQNKLAKTLSPGDQSTLLWVHDYLGMPVEVILMIIEYAVTQGKTGINYIEKIAIDWTENEIDSIEKAEHKIHEIKLSENYWKKICSLFQITYRKPTKNELKYIHSWKDKKISDSVLTMAYEECANHTGKMSFPYINKVLEKWCEEGISTVEQAKKYIASKKLRKGENSGRPRQRDVSYDIEEYERIMMQTPIEYHKNL